MDIRFDAAGVSFEGRPALQPLTLSLTERRIGVIGLNGSGKTTFAKLINGLVKPTTGRVTVDGLDTVKDADAVLGRVAFVFQNPQNQLIMPGVAEDIAFGLTGRGLSKAEIAERVDAMLSSLGISDLARRRVHELSGGETQLVAMASVLVTGAGILILDEPTNQLDLRNRRQVMEAVGCLPQTVITIAHDLNLLVDYDRVLLFDGGRLVYDGKPAASIARYREIAAC